MKYLVFILSVSIFSPNFLTGQFSKEEFYKLHNLSGIWKRDVTKGMNHEFWNKISETEMTGAAYHINGTDTLLRETVALTFKEGEIKYIVTAYGQNDNSAIAFKLIKIENSIFSFENPDHDFPNKIIYDNSNKYTLRAVIEGMIGGSLKKIDYNFIRIK